MTEEPESDEGTPDLAGDERSSRLSDSLRRAAAALTGEERISNAKEALSSILQQGERGRKEVVRIVAGEVADFLRGMDMPGVIRKALAGMRVEVQASVRFHEDDDGVDTEVKSTTHRTADAGESQASDPQPE